MRFGYLLMLFITLSCASKKNIFMLQDLKNNDVINYEFEDYKIKNDDVLKIEVKTNDLRTRIGTENNFNQFQNTTRESLIYDGYMVNSNGFIDFHGLGKIYVKGLTVNEIKSIIFKLLTQGQILKNPIMQCEKLFNFLSFPFDKSIVEGFVDKNISTNNEGKSFKLPGSILDLENKIEKLTLV